MYCCDFVCTYKRHTEADSENAYRSQFLQALNLTKWVDSEVDTKLNNLFLKMKSSNQFEQVIQALKNNITSSSLSLLINTNDDNNIDDILFRLLFSYNLFDYSHRCIIDFLNTNEINNKHLTELLKNINI